ncbi:hypothetical protein PHMEG_0007784 [Phytophthora megakarya]|uniref:Uncharacterized protein n=1 Tax=Phytophthora megakarya TaxID=4795 RepID=A0A225WM03_9STRA|nr:hypothetical protein PHMEG_0007784 [Phytophthora megakarya]
MLCNSSQTSSAPVSASQPRVLGHKRRRDGVITASPLKPEEETDACLSNVESCCTTSGESSSDESDVEEVEEVEEEEMLAAAKRRRQDLDDIEKSVRRMEAQVVDASAQLRDLAALVALVVAQRQQQTQLQA